ncbi:MAG TPA: O-methyltransferase [Terriglobia bacterium]|nr:O-methyltransferase [Terriglobia bacterium]
MRKILEPAVEGYMNALLPSRDPVLREMERYAAKHEVPIVGPACARALFQLACSIKAERVFEMGSAIGYSTLWLARAVGPKGAVFYTDSDPENARRAEDYLGRAGMRERVRFLVGDALKMLASTEGQFDIVFNDVNKIQYPRVLRLAAPRVRPGGLFISDNVLWSGRVAGPLAKEDASTRAIKTFNSRLYRSKEFFTVIIPLRDGLAVSRKNE